ESPRPGASVGDLHARESRVPAGHAPRAGVAWARRSEPPLAQRRHSVTSEPGYELSLTVNGRTRTVVIAPHHTLLDVLRDDLGLTGSKACCLVGECGACTVMLNGRSVDACLVLGAEADGGDVVTVEGLAHDGGLSRLQRAFLETGAAQCGFCIPGQLMSGH